MRTTFAASLLLAAGAATTIGQTQTPTPAVGRPADATHQRPAGMTWRMPPSDERYAAIDQARLMRYVSELTAMAQRYRDNGHPQFWGRIIGTTPDAENANWMMEKFRQFGLTDVHEQFFDLPPQWMPRSWSVVAERDDKTLALGTAQPTYLSQGTTPAGLDLEAVYVGMASDADLALSRDVKGKAVFFYSTDTSSRHVGVMDNAIKRLSDRGAAAIFVIQGIPGNLRTQFYPVNSPVPTFSLGQRDGLALRDLVAAPAAPPRVRIRLDVERIPNLKSGTVWATLPGMTDETVVVVSHRDGWFDGANDNASGVATAVEIAEFLSRIPKAERRRTVVFLGTTGHHNNGGESGAWFAQHPEVFAKTAVLLNAEHTGAAQSGHNSTRLSNGGAAASWFATGEPLARLVTNALDAFGVVTYPQSSARPAGEIGRYFQFAPAMQIMTSGFVWHSDGESAESISPGTLTAITRAYAKVIVDSNGLSLQDLRQAVAPATR